MNQGGDSVAVQREGGVAVVSLRRPDSLNALDMPTLEALLAFAEGARVDPALRAVVLTGEGAAFSGGADTSLLQDSLDRSRSLLERRSRVSIGPRMCEAWSRIEAPTLAAIEGNCVGGGLALALCCDFRLAGASASFRLPEVPLGMNMSWRSLPRLAALVGPSRAKRLAMFGGPVDAQTALMWGLIDEVAPHGQALSAAREWAERLAAAPPIPVRMTKEAIDAAVNLGAEAAAHMDRDQWLLSVSSLDFSEGLDAMLEKRKPSFKGD